MQNYNQSQLVTTYSELTPKQKQRYDSIFSVFEDDALKIVQCVTGKGKHSWQAFLDKMELMRKVSVRDREYYNSLYDSFSLNELYTPAQIISIIAEVRRELELPPYSDKIKVLSEQDFFRIFLVEEVFEESVVGEVVKRVLKGYRPIICIKPQ